MLNRRILQSLVVVCLAVALFYGFGFGPRFQLVPADSKREVDFRKPKSPTIKPVRPALKILPIENKIILGVYEQNVVKSRTVFEEQIGADVSIVALYQTWADKKNKFPLSWVEGIVEQDQIPMLTWEPWEFSVTDFDQPSYRLSGITDGQHDEYLREWLTDARDWQGPIFVRFAHEMNGNWYPWGQHVNTPAEYVAAWRYIIDMSRELAADNITWVWSPNEVEKSDRLSDRLDNFYPGNEYVDWIGVSGYNWGGLEPWQRWRSFSQIFDPALDQLKKYNKPLMIAEIGVASNPRAGKQTKAAWITETLVQAKNNDPPISMFVWFNDKYMSGGKLYDWRIGDSSDSIDAMKTGLDDPAFVKSLN